MKLALSTNKLGVKRLFANSTEKYCLLGCVCKEAGLEDSEIEFASSVILDNKKSLPKELEPFFVKDDRWNPISPRFKDSNRFTLSGLGKMLAGLNDNKPDGWKEQAVNTLADNGVELEWLTD